MSSACGFGRKLVNARVHTLPNHNRQELASSFAHVVSSRLSRVLWLHSRVARWFLCLSGRMRLKMLPDERPKTTLFWQSVPRQCNYLPGHVCSWINITSLATHEPDRCRIPCGTTVSSTGGADDVFFPCVPFRLLRYGNRPL